MGLDKLPSEKQFTKAEAVEVFAKSVFNGCLLSQEEVAGAMK